MPRCFLTKTGSKVEQKSHLVYKDTFFYSLKILNVSLDRL